jgi:hypothetical protein
MRFKLLLLLLFLCCGTLLPAGENMRHKKAIQELLLASGVPAMLQRAFKAQLDSQLKAVPELEKIRPQLTAFYEKAFSFKELEPELCRLYMKHYSIEEARQITAFYQTPAGKKMAQVNGLISTELGELFLKHSQKKMPELQKLLKNLN